MHRQDDEPGVQPLLTDDAQGFQAAELGHRDVGHDDIGLEPPNRLDQLPAVRDRRHQLHLRREQVRERLAEHRVVVRENDPGSTHRKYPLCELHREGP